MSTINVKTSERFETWVSKTNDLNLVLGDTSNLTVDDVVSGLNQLVDNIGDISQLETVANFNLVVALNEIKRTAIVMALTLASPIN